MRLVACLVPTVFALAIVPATAVAGEGCSSGFDVASHLFEQSDSDGSGTLTIEEYAEAGLERYGVSFDEYDANGDGVTTLDEYLDLYDRHHPVGEGEIES